MGRASKVISVKPHLSKDDGECNNNHNIMFIHCKMF